MNTAERIAANRATLNAPQPPDSIRLQVFVNADGPPWRIDGCSTVLAAVLTPGAALAYLGQLRRLVASVEQNVLEQAASRRGLRLAELQILLDAVDAHADPCDSVVMCQEAAR